MIKKKWYISKTFWACTVTILIGAYNTAALSYSLPAIPDFVIVLFGSLGIYGRTTAKTILIK